MCRLGGEGFAGAWTSIVAHVVNEDRSRCVVLAGSRDFGDADVSRPARKPSRYLHWGNVREDLLERGTWVS